MSWDTPPESHGRRTEGTRSGGLPKAGTPDFPAAGVDAPGGTGKWRSATDEAERAQRVQRSAQLESEAILERLAVPSYLRETEPGGPDEGPLPGEQEAHNPVQTGPEADESQALGGSHLSEHGRHRAGDHGRQASPRLRAGLVVAAVAVLGASVLTGVLLDGRGDGEQPLLADNRGALPTVYTTPSDSPILTVPVGPSPSSASPSPSPSPSKTKKPPAVRTRPAPPPTRSAAVRTPSATPPPSPTPAPVGLSFGDSGQEVADLQCRLAQLSFYEGREDGYFDRGVENALARFQDDWGVQGEPRGTYGPESRRLLESRTISRSQFHDGYDDGY